jgi:lipoprotein-anchoring transpeptidase ErfK/SrfK
MLSRRDFLKLSGAALLGILFSDIRTGRAARAPLQGRVLYSRMKVRAAPSFSGEQTGSLLFDNLVNIAEQVTGGTLEDYNRTWYRLQAGGYVYSGGIQPVKTILNEPLLEIPEAGSVGEVTIPYADSMWAVNRSPVPGPRLYYQSTHWVVALVHDALDGSLWYKCYDNLWKTHYYTRPEWVHIYTESELAPIAPHVPEYTKHIEVILDEQMLYAFTGNTLVYAARTSTGQHGFETPTGWFRTFHKRPTYHMTGGYDDASIFDLPGVPWDSYITDGGIAIHGTFWHNDFGTGHSHGCINLTPEAARWVYRWTSPRVPPGEKLVLAPNSGTRVRIRQTRPSNPWSEP